MALLLPQGTDTLGAFNHALMHRIIAVDDTASEQSLVINPTHITCGVPVLLPGDSRIGTATQYWTIEQFTEIAGEFYPMLAPYSDGATYGNIGVIKNNCIIAGLDAIPQLIFYDKTSASVSALGYTGTQFQCTVPFRSSALQVYTFTAGDVDGLILSHSGFLRNQDGDSILIRSYAKRKQGFLGGTVIETGRIAMELTSADETTNYSTMIFYTENTDALTERARIDYNGLQVTGLRATSTNICTNVNADLLDGYHSSSFLLDAASDGKTYGRKNSAWSALQIPLTADIDYYVSPTGSDVTGTGTELNPFATIQKCIDMTSPIMNGYTLNIYLKDGSYNLETAIKGYDGGYINIASQNNDSTLVDITGGSIFEFISSTSSIYVSALSLKISANDGSAIFAQTCASIYTYACRVGLTASYTNTVGIVTIDSLFSAAELIDIPALTPVETGIYIVSGTTHIDFTTCTAGTTPVLHGGGLATDMNTLFLTTPNTIPTNDYDVANKKYVDDSIPTTLWTKTGTTISPVTDDDDVQIIVSKIAATVIAIDAQVDGGDGSNSGLVYGVKATASAGDTSPVYGVHSTIGGTTANGMAGYFVNTYTGGSSASVTLANSTDAITTSGAIYVNSVYRLPIADGAAGYVLTSHNDGTTTWDVAGGGLPAGTIGQVLQYKADGSTEAWQAVNTLYDTQAVPNSAIDIANRIFYASDGIIKTINWDSVAPGSFSNDTSLQFLQVAGVTYPSMILGIVDYTGVLSANTDSRILYGTDGTTQVLNWGLITGLSERGIATQGYILDFVAVTKSIDPNERILYAENGTTSQLDWNAPNYVRPGTDGDNWLGYNEPGNEKRWRGAYFKSAVGAANPNIIDILGEITAYAMNFDNTAHTMSIFDTNQGGLAISWQNKGTSDSFTLGDAPTTESMARFMHSGSSDVFLAVDSVTHGTYGIKITQTTGTAGYFTDGARTVTICENSTFYGLTVIDSDYTIRLVDNANNYAAIFQDTGAADEVIIANGSYGVQATRSGAYIGYLGSANWAVRGEDISATHMGMLCDATYGGVFQYGAVNVNLASSTTAGSFTDGSRTADLCNGTYAGVFHYEGTPDYDVQICQSNTAIVAQGAGESYVNLAWNNGTVYAVYAAIQTTGVAGEFTDGVNTVQLANGSYAVEATAGGLKGAHASSDGTVGDTEDVVCAKDGGGTVTLSFKDGIFTGSA